MHKKAQIRFGSPFSDNRKSKTCTERSRSIQNRKWAGLFAIVVVLTLCGPRAEAQQPAKVSRIGVLRPGSPPDRYNEAFRSGLRDLGYVEGENIAIEYRFGEGRPERTAKFAAELARLKVDIIVTSGEATIRTVSQTTQKIPIVMANSGDPVGSGLVASLARPGGNVTGLSALSPELSGKALELLRDTLPKLSRAAVLWNSANAAKVLDFKETQLTAKAMGVQLQSLEVRGLDDIEVAFGAALRDRTEALSVRADAVVTLVHRQQIVGRAAKARLPTIYEVREFVDTGGLMSYGPDLSDNFRRAAIYVDKIVKGAKPADLPVERATKFELVINLIAAKQIGLTIPPNVLARADRVVK